MSGALCGEAGTYSKAPDRYAPGFHRALEAKGAWVLCEDTDGSVWGYSAVPDDAIARWRALPEG